LSKSAIRPGTPAGREFSYRIDLINDISLFAHGTADAPDEVRNRQE
jgi:hypothetical protein